MGHRAYLNTGQTDAFGNEKRRPAFAKKAYRATSPADIGGRAHRLAVEQGTPVNTLSIPSALGMTVPYQVATGEMVRKAFGVTLHYAETPVVAPKGRKPVLSAGQKRAPRQGVGRAAADPRIGRDAVKRCSCCGEPVNACFNL